MRKDVVLSRKVQKFREDKVSATGRAFIVETIRRIAWPPFRKGRRFCLDIVERIIQLKRYRSKSIVE
jgi:hypothetical protein